MGGADSCRECAEAGPADELDDSGVAPGVASVVRVGPDSIAGSYSMAGVAGAADGGDVQGAELPASGS